MSLRVFISQTTIDDWVSTDQVELQGEVITLRPSQRQIRLTPASFFKNVAGHSLDSLGLVGKVKDQDAIAGLGGEAYMSSVVIGEDAYDIEPGFLAREVAPAPGGDVEFLQDLATMAG
jgi:hypothetical protein